MKQEQSNNQDRWVTHFEKSGGISSPSFEETMRYFEHFTRESPFAKMITLGFSPQGRPIRSLIVSNNREFTAPKARDSGKLIVLIQNGIHAGEIEGKDATMLLLREILITKEKAHLLKNLILLVLPIFNVDGHERTSEFNRPNQNGPKEMGWRTTSLNYNLNRDFMKGDAPEMKIFLRFFNDWLPDFVIDNHTTDGADYQYHISYGLETNQNIHKETADFLKEKFIPHLTKTVEEKGFLVCPYLEFKNNKIENGIILEPSLPRYSTGYAALHNRICLLVETHSLKPFENRVYSTKAMNEVTLEYLNDNHLAILAMNLRADKKTVDLYYGNNEPFPIKFALTEESELFAFKGFKTFEEESEITGSTVTRYTNEPVEFEVPLFNKAEVTEFCDVPEAYLIPRELHFVIYLLKLHKIYVEQLFQPHILHVERMRFKNVKFYDSSFEGRQMIGFDLIKWREKKRISEGTFVVRANQRSLRVIVNLLEPTAPDSLAKWGFFNMFLERKEYIEPYAMEPVAKKMLAENERYRKDFYQKLETDESFKNDPAKRLDFFYKRCQFFDKSEKIYPIIKSFDKIRTNRSMEENYPE